jgi:hypothetical protein
MNCFGLTSIDVSTSNTAYSSDSGILFNKTKTTLVQYPIGRTGNYTIPDSVEEIGAGAFWDCAGLTSVIIPNSVTEIGVGAFLKCTGLKSITIPSLVADIKTYAFLGCAGLTEVINESAIPQTIDENVFIGVNISACTLRVPATSLDVYRAAEWWQDFENITAI